MPSAGGSTVTNTRPPPYLAAFSTRLPSISSRSCRSTRTCGVLVAGDVDGDVLVQPVDRALRPPRALSHTRARAWAEARRPIARARARWWSTWRRIAAASRQTVSARSGALRGGGVGDDGQRGLQRMGEVAGVAARFLGLRLAMGEQLVDLLDQRLDLAREILGDAGLRARPDRGDLAPHAAQRPQAVEGLQRGEDEQADAERGEAPDQGRAQARGSGRRSSRATGRPGSASGRSDPGRMTSRSSDAQRLAGEFVAVVACGARRRCGGRRRAAAGPTASATGRCPAPSPLIWK